MIVNVGDYRLFSKAGGYTKARSDFESLGLTGIRKTQVGIFQKQRLIMEINNYFPFFSLEVDRQSAQNCPFKEPIAQKIL